MIKTKKIPGYPKYEISSDGKVYSINGFGQRYGRRLALTPIINHSGYHIVTLSNSKPRKFMVHRLVAQAFLPNVENLPIIHHKDSNKQNNDYQNLKWVSHSTNMIHHSKDRDYSKFDIAGHKNPNSTAVMMYDMNNKFIRQYESLADAQKDGFLHSGISMCINEKRKHYAGFIWKRAESSIVISERDELLRRIKEYKPHLSKMPPHHKMISVYDSEGCHIKDFPSITCLTNIGFTRSCITGCINGYYKTHRGFVFKKKE